ncbi:ATP-grasp domain-containing protein [Candidatus Saccharibacteria bacterium]|nr:ATP-grasp domain-containing protein [Candidatus Saccharibacteria bacterium]
MAKLMITARAIVAELEKRGIVVVAEMPERVTILSFIYAGSRRTIIGCTPDFSSALTIPVCRSKLMTNWLLTRDTDIPLPASTVYTDMHMAQEFLTQQKVIVVKPQDGAHGDGVTVGVCEQEHLLWALNIAKDHSTIGSVLLQQLVHGKDVRVLVLDGKIVAATYRIPARVIGDGERSIKELINYENDSNPNRGKQPYDERLNQIDINAANRYLGDDINRVPERDEEVTVVGTANIGTGGEAHECAGELPETLKAHAIKATQAVKAFICGVDFIYNPETGRYYLIELNSSPSFGLHMWPSQGNAVDIAPLYVDALLARYAKGGA